MGLVRFREWIEEEGLSGSKALLQFHQDAKAYAGLVDEVQVSHRCHTVTLDIAICVLLRLHGCTA